MVHLQNVSVIYKFTKYRIIKKRVWFVKAIYAVILLCYLLSRASACLSIYHVKLFIPGCISYCLCFYYAVWVNDKTT